MKETSSIAQLVGRSRRAFAEREFATQEEVDYICSRVAWAGCREPFARLIAEHAFAATGLGDVGSKLVKMRKKLKAVYAQTIGARTCGLIDTDTARGLLVYAKPVGVIGALVPVTNPEMTPFIKALWALKTRNSIVLAPHPAAQSVNTMAVSEIRRVLRAYSWPEDLVIGIPEASVAVSNELMASCDLILATGGAAMVKAAYSSGKPAFGVGTGNAVIIVDETADVAETAREVMQSKTFDLASGCSADNSCLVQASIYDRFVRELTEVGGFIIRDGSPEKARLQQAMWTKRNVLNRGIVARPAVRIAELAGIHVPAETLFLIVEEHGVGDDYPFSREKLSPVLTLYRWESFDVAVDMVNEITANCGAGHSCGIHSFNEDRIRHLAAYARVARVTVRQAHALANAGSWGNGLMQTATLGCGTWGNNVVSENVYFKHLLNTTRVAFPTNGAEPSDEEVFGRTVISEFERRDG